MATELNWTNVNPANLSTELQNRYAQMKEAYKVYAQRKGEFEQAMQAEFGGKLSADKELKFGYNFGKLSIAIGDKRPERKAKQAQTDSLGDWLAAQQANGRAS